METAADREWWLDEVIAEVSKYRAADAQKQEEICGWVARVFGAKAAAEARKLFDAWKPVDDEDGEGGASFQDEKPRADDQAPVLSSGSPRDSAREYTRRYCFKEGMLALYYYQKKVLGMEWPILRRS